MSESTLDPRDHLLARQELIWAVAELATRQGLEGEALRKRAVDIAEALRDGLFVLSSAAAFGSNRPVPDAPR